MRSSMIAAVSVACLVVRQAAADSHTPLVEIDGDAEVELSEVVPDAGPVARCTVPCDMHLTAGRQYVVGGPGVETSEPFRLPHATALHLEVETGAPKATTVGEILGIAGGGVLGLGLYILANQDGRTELGATLSFAAVPMLVGGALLVHHGRTTVTLVSHRVTLDARRGAITF